jgi:hypothetical protein
VNRAWAVALALLVVVGCSPAAPTTAPTPRGSSLIAGANVHCGAFEGRPELCHDMAATAIQAVAIHSIEVRDVWLRPVPLCYFDIVCLFDPNAPIPAETPPLGGEWVGSVELSFDDGTEHAGVNLAQVGNQLVVKQIGYGVPPPTWCSGGCPTPSP